MLVSPGTTVSLDLTDLTGMKLVCDSAVRYTASEV